MSLSDSSVAAETQETLNQLRDVGWTDSTVLSSVHASGTQTQVLIPFGQISPRMLTLRHKNWSHVYSICRLDATVTTTHKSHGIVANTCVPMTLEQLTTPHLVDDPPSPCKACWEQDRTNKMCCHYKQLTASVNTPICSTHNPLLCGLWNLFLDPHTGQSSLRGLKEDFANKYFLFSTLLTGIICINTDQHILETFTMKVQLVTMFLFL